MTRISWVSTLCNLAFMKVVMACIFNAKQLCSYGGELLERCFMYFLVVLRFSSCKHRYCLGPSEDQCTACPYPLQLFTNLDGRSVCVTACPDCASAGTRSLQDSGSNNRVQLKLFACMHGAELRSNSWECLRTCHGSTSKRSRFKQVWKPAYAPPPISSDSTWTHAEVLGLLRTRTAPASSMTPSS